MPPAILPPLVAACLAAAAAAAFRFTSTEALASATLAGLMAAVAACDLQRLRVPDSLAVLSALAGLVWLWLLEEDAGSGFAMAAAEAGVQIAVCGGSLLLLREAFYRLMGTDGLGLGDVKLAAAAGAWIDWDMFTVAALVASSGALVFVTVTTFANGGWPRARRIPFAAYLAPAIWAAWFAGRM